MRPSRDHKPTETKESSALAVRRLRLPVGILPANENMRSTEVDVATDVSASYEETYREQIRHPSP